MPVPSAVISVPISCELSILSKRARSTFRILPRNGRIAWLARLRPCLAEPPAESPSTMNSSESAGSRSWQSASLPGNELTSSAPLRRVSSRALRAASRAAAASTTFVRILRVSDGCSSNHWPSLSLITDSTTGRTAVEILGEGLDAAFVEQVGDLGRRGALVGQDDAHARVQERQLAQPMLQRGEVELGLGEGLGRGQEGHFRAVLAGRRIAYDLEVA